MSDYIKDVLKDAIEEELSLGGVVRRGLQGGGVVKLEPTEAQRKAMLEWMGEVDPDDFDYEEWLDGLFAAANSIPEGAPVGTIARRPDGAWKAERKAGEARPYWQYSTSAFWQADSPDWNSEDDADSWPQIRPDQWPDQAGLEWFPPGEEPTVPRPNPTAQQEPAYTVAAASEEMAKYWDNSIVTTTKREPRVVDRLGVDEQGSRWRDENGLIHSFTEGADGGRWKTQIGGSWYPWAKGVVPHGGEYTEILEPRVLPSLDCEEARDGTEWKFRLNGEPRSLVYRNNGWRYGEVGDRIGGRCGVSDGHAFIREFAPYIEVVGDPS